LCLGKRCPKPDIPRNGRIFGNKFFIGSTVEFFCNSGFTLYGSRKRTCQDDKTWNGTVAVCDDGSKLSRIRVNIRDKLEINIRMMLELYVLKMKRIIQITNYKSIVSER
jgi:hypothetical protein